jgi:phosphoribosylaminoimidazolecarboxamide formyltransferase / IMP cyclohydrolase
VANTIDNYVGATADKGWVSSIEGPAPADLTAEERKQWAASLTGVALGSDAFFPFADNIQRAKLVIKFFSCTNFILRSVFLA